MIVNEAGKNKFNDYRLVRIEMKIPKAFANGQ